MNDAGSEYGSQYAGEGKAGDIVLASCLASIGVAIYLYSQGKRDAGIFVGLWAPTILSLGSFLQAGRAWPSPSAAPGGK
jgi:hypothetical protein